MQCTLQWKGPVIIRWMCRETLISATRVSKWDHTRYSGVLEVWLISYTLFIGEDWNSEAGKHIWSHNAKRRLHDNLLPVTTDRHHLMDWEPENRIAEARFIYGRLILLHVNYGYFVRFFFLHCVCVWREGCVCVIGAVGMGASEPWHIHGGQRPTCESQISACITWVQGTELR